ncbi:MAG: transcription termination/antitermination protein NusA [Candidatus Hydrogenedentota bacterium]|nr:MAG: transcription termination/antitermination protein NusA [Candidatus Hydrogenedentota bacterium]
MRTKKTIQKKNPFFEAIHQVVAEKGFSREAVMEVIEAGLLAAYRKKYKTSENVRVIFDKENEEVYTLSKRQVVDKVVLPGMQISLTEAKKLQPDIQIGDEIEIREDPTDFGRIAAQTASQVITNKLRELEQQRIKEEYSEKVGELLNGYILRKRGDTVYVDLGRVEAIMPKKHQIPTEKYRVEDKIKVLLYSLEEDGRNLKVIVSRAAPLFVQKLFEIEVPEVYEGTVEIKKVGRIPGVRSKVVVYSERPEVDPVGACVGVRGVRIQAIVRELGTERIDIVEYSEDPREFIANALTPATPTMVKVDADNKEALAVVPDRELSQAIGKEGANVKIASYITGYRIDVKSESEFSQEMSTPEARQRLDALFSKTEVVEEEEPEEEGTPLEELPGLTKRVQKLLKEAGIHYLEDLLELDEEDLINIEGIGRATASTIFKLLSEHVDIEEIEEEEDETSDEDGQLESESSEEAVEGESKEELDEKGENS